MASWFGLMPLEGFFFFGSATVWYLKLKELIKLELTKPRAERLRILILDCAGLTGMDPSACAVLDKAHRHVESSAGPH